MKKLFKILKVNPVSFFTAGYCRQGLYFVLLRVNLCNVTLFLIRGYNANLNYMGDLRPPRWYFLQIYHDLCSIKPEDFFSKINCCYVTSNRNKIGLWSICIWIYNMNPTPESSYFVMNRTPRCRPGRVPHRTVHKPTNTPRPFFMIQPAGAADSSVVETILKNLRESSTIFDMQRYRTPNMTKWVVVKYLFYFDKVRNQTKMFHFVIIIWITPGSQIFTYFFQLYKHCVLQKESLSWKQNNEWSALSPWNAYM